MFQKSILSTFLLLLIVSSTLGAEPIPMPESHLLLPYFEVSLEGLEQMTFFSLVNTSDEELDLTATVYTNWAIPVLDVHLRLAGKESLPINLHDWIVQGRLSADDTVCADAAADCMDLIHLQDALSGRRSSMNDLYYSSELEEGVATGFITIRADDSFLPESDVLWGDYFYTDPVENFAQGQRLVRLEANLSCADLCGRHAIRFLEGGGFSGGTKLTIWSWDGVEREPSKFPSPQFQLGSTQIDVYSQQGKLVDILPQIDVLPVQTILVSDLGLGQNFGWLDITTQEVSSISGFYRAMGKFSVGVPSWCLPCDPCNSLGACYEPNHPSCPGACIPADVRIAGNGKGTVDQPFSLTFHVSGTPDIAVTVSDLPEGLILSGNTISGTPREAGTFTITATNECATDRARITIDPSTPVEPKITTLKLVKTVINDDGGTKTVADFKLYVKRPGSPKEQVLSGEELLLGLVTSETITAVASEGNLPGYQAGPWTGDCNSAGEVTLTAGDNKVCYITNDDIPAPKAYLTLIKEVVNDNGGTKMPGDFALFISGQKVTTGQRVKLSPGDYTASEQNLPGYDAGPWTGACAANGSVTLAENDDKVCIITNNDQYNPPPKAYLTLVKEVINDNGGTKMPGDFALFISGQQVTTGQRVELSPGTYTASEQNLPGYDAGPWTGACAANGNVTLAEDDDKVCVITNNDQYNPPPKAYLTLIKQVVNDHGGTAQPSDFALFISGQQVTSGQRVELSPGTYTASEQNLPGYDAGSWTGACAANGSVTLAEDDDKVCIIINNDRPAMLTLVKHVINDDGGTAQPDDFHLKIGTLPVLSGVAVPLPAGTYKASETNLPGYDAGPWSGACAADGSVTLQIGDVKVCEITNNDRPAMITLIKHVINDDGGTAQPDDFDLKVGTHPVQSGVAIALPAGVYKASEKNLDGYIAGTWGGDCAADGSVTLQIGDVKVCEITNNDEAVCNPNPTFSAWNGKVDANYPHDGVHHTEVSFDYKVQGELDGEVQLFWMNGGSTYIKKRIYVHRKCEDSATTGHLFWQSDAKSHHPGHGAKYFARLIVGGQVVQSVALN